MPGRRQGAVRDGPGDPRAQAQERELERTIEILKAAASFLRAGVRPATPLICAFIDAHKGRFGVAPVCRALAAHGMQIAPRSLLGAPVRRAVPAGID